MLSQQLFHWVYMICESEIRASTYALHLSYFLCLPSAMHELLIINRTGMILYCSLLKKIICVLKIKEWKNLFRKFCIENIMYIYIFLGEWIKIKIHAERKKKKYASDYESLSNIYRILLRIFFFKQWNRSHRWCNISIYTLHNL